ncbi:50S ribosomal protein L18, chloroplastic [Apostasia shenzhenica]|uniref:50S ribosomal protein L18, chloroplastic n=1 Tax=Apostasia shenzhenica TaxID=1088818 RepID=A0A2I0AIM3_9ASPA|nr:50S ribosomal protein L18, chloroplastic [Apostasia shenzhenica]
MVCSSPSLSPAEYFPVLFVSGEFPFSAARTPVPLFSIAIPVKGRELRCFAGNRLLCYPCFRSTAQLRRPVLFRRFRASLALVSKVNLSLLESNLFPVHHNTHLCANNHFVTIHMPFSEVQGRISLKIVARGIQHKESPKTKNRRLRRKFSGTPKKPRLSVFCSTRQLYALLVDDQNQKTLFYASTLQNSIRDDPPCSTLEAAHRVGEAIVKACKELNISEISSYDRNGFHRGRRMRAFEVAIAEHGLLPH